MDLPSEAGAVKDIVAVVVPVAVTVSIVGVPGTHTLMRLFVSSSLFTIGAFPQ